MPRLLPEQISTTRLRLRQPELADSHSIFQAYAQDTEVCRFMIWKPHASEAITREFMESCHKAWEAGDRLPYVITESTSNDAIGMIEARMLGTAVDIGYVLARRHWGKGFMPEAIVCVGRCRARLHGHLSGSRSLRYRERPFAACPGEIRLPARR